MVPLGPRRSHGTGWEGPPWPPGASGYIFHNHLYLQEPECKREARVRQGEGICALRPREMSPVVLTPVHDVGPRQFWHT